MSGEEGGEDPYFDESSDIGFVGVVVDPVPCRAALFNGRESCINEPSKWKVRKGNEFGFTTYATRRPRMAHCPKPRMGNE